MRERIQKLIKPSIYLTAILFAVCCLVKKPQEISGLTEYLGYSSAAMTVCYFVYEKWLWRKIPWNRPPVLKAKYIGTIRYIYNEVADEKPIHVQINQSWLQIEIKTSTDINSSVAIVADIVQECGQDVLYYTYMTNPTAETQSKNPIQYGTCRMVLNEDNTKISGKYWTSAHTTGDIEWAAEESEN